ncbi:MAG: hypothetical protein U0792_23775 [Gemmataceae bacterium]
MHTGTHQWLKDPNLPDWKFPFRSGYSAAGRVLKVGKDFPGGFQEGAAERPGLRLGRTAHRGTRALRGRCPIR